MANTIIRRKPFIQRTVKKLLRALANYDPDYYDMYSDPNESFFAQIYLSHFLGHLKQAGIHPPAKVLEAGCQTGRLAIPLSKAGYAVTGVERSGFALRRARSHAKSENAKTAWVKGDFMDVLRGKGAQPFDAAICAEILYTVKDYGNLIKTIASALRPGGLVFASHRQRFYYLIESLKHNDLAKAREVASSGESVFGQHFAQSGYFNWQTPSELKEVYQSLGLEWIAVHPIDRFAWLTGTNPGEFSKQRQQRWLNMELTLPEQELTTARYLLVVARKPASAQS